MLTWIEKVALLARTAGVVVAAGHASSWTGHTGVPFRKVAQSASDACLRVCTVHAVWLTGFAGTGSDVVPNRTLQADTLIVLVLTRGASPSAEVATIVGEVDTKARAALTA